MGTRFVVSALLQRRLFGGSGLTPREQDVLDRLTLGRTNREIATDLFISEKTASVHVSNIKSKLGANGRAEIAAIAVRLGLVPETTDGDELAGPMASASPRPAGRSAPRSVADIPSDRR